MGVDKVEEGEELRQNIRINTTDFKQGKNLNEILSPNGDTKRTSREYSSDDSDSNHHSTSHISNNRASQIVAEFLKHIAPHQTDTTQITITINNNNTTINHIIQKSNEDSQKLNEEYKVERETDAKLKELQKKVDLCVDAIKAMDSKALVYANNKKFYEYFNLKYPGNLYS